MSWKIRAHRVADPIDRRWIVDGVTSSGTREARNTSNVWAAYHIAPERIA